MLKNLICIDIGSHLTKILEADLNKGVLEILSFNSLKTPQHDNEIDGAALLEQLSELIPMDRLRASNIALSVPASAINFTILELPKMPKGDLDKAVIVEAKRKILPVPGEEDIFDYSILGEKRVKDTVQLNIFVGAGKKSEIVKYLSPFQKKGLVPSFVGSTPLALIMYFYEYKSNPTENWALIDIGYRNTSIVIFNKNEVALIRDIRFACFDFIKAAAKKSSLIFGKAEELFLREQIKDELLNDSWQYLLSELRHSFAYYKEITAGQRIDSILFSGGMFKLKQSLDFLRKNVGGNLEGFELASSKCVSTERFTPGDLADHGPLFATALGLAFGFKPLKKVFLNFLPSEIYRQKRIRKIKFFSVQALSIMAITLFFIIVSMFIRIGLAKTQIDVLSRGFSEPDYKRVNAEATRIKSILTSLNKQKDLIAKISKYEFNHEKTLSVISNVIPEEVYLKDIEIGFDQNQQEQQAFLPELEVILTRKSRKRKEEISVKIIAAVFGDYDLVREESESFYRALLDSQYFFKVNLGPIQLEEIVIRGQASQGRITEFREREFQIDAKVKLDEKINP